MKERIALGHECVKTIPEKLEERTLYISMDYATVLARSCCFSLMYFFSSANAFRAVAVFWSESSQFRRSGTWFGRRGVWSSGKWRRFPYPIPVTCRTGGPGRPYCSPRRAMWREMARRPGSHAGICAVLSCAKMISARRHRSIRSGGVL